MSLDITMQDDNERIDYYVLLYQSEIIPIFSMVTDRLEDLSYSCKHSVGTYQARNPFHP